MKIVNKTPFAAGGLFVTADAGSDKLTAIVKGTFALTGGLPAEIAADQKPLSGDRYAGDNPKARVRYEDDFAPFKPRADVLLVGQAPGASGTVQVGTHAATLADFSPVSRDSARRAEMAGPHGGDWFASHWPRLGAAIPWDYFNAAPKEMQIEGYFDGDEHLTLENLHPERSGYQVRLPGLRVRCFLGAGEDRFEEIDMLLDTLWLDVAAETLILVWRGRIQLEGGDAPRLLVAVEPLAEPAQPADAYRDEPAFSESDGEASPADLAGAVDLSLVKHGIAPDSLPPELRAFLADPAASSFPSAGPDMFDADQVVGVDALAGSGDFDAMIAATMASTDTPADALPIELRSLNAKAPAATPDAPEPRGQADTAPPPKAEAIGESSDPEQAPSSDPNAELDSILAEKGMAPSDLPAAARSLAVAPDASVAGEAGAPGDPAVAAMLADADRDMDAVAFGGGDGAPKLRRFDTPQSVPSWPPESAEDAAAIADLAAALGGDRPPNGDGLNFLEALSVLAADAAAPSGPDESQRGQNGATEAPSSTHAKPAPMKGA